VADLGTYQASFDIGIELFVHRAWLRNRSISDRNRADCFADDASDFLIMETRNLDAVRGLVTPLHKRGRLAAAVPPRTADQ